MNFGIAPSSLKGTGAVGYVSSSKLGWKPLKIYIVLVYSMWLFVNHIHANTKKLIEKKNDIYIFVFQTIVFPEIIVPKILTHYNMSQSFPS